MEEEYKMSCERIKEILINEVEDLTIEKWNMYAKKEVLLSAESLQYISGLKWQNLIKELREKL